MSYAPLPDELAGWRWSDNPKTGHVFLMHPKHAAIFTTRHYPDGAKAIAEAKRWVLSQPKERGNVTTQDLNTDQTIKLLRGRGYTVKLHGARYLVAYEGNAASPMTADELTMLVERSGDTAGESAPGWTASCGRCGQQFISDAPVADGAICPACSPVAAAPAQIDVAGTMPLMLLIGVLNDHAQHLPKPLPTDYRIPLPLAVPERLQVPIDLVKPGRYQPRTSFDETELHELSESIHEHGILNPLIVFASERGDLELIAGERRLRAARLEGLSFVPIEIRSYTLAQIAEISGLDNLQRANLSRLEEGRYYNRLVLELGISENQLAKRLGKNRSHIQQCRAIAVSAPEVVTALDSGAITFSQARAIATAAPGDAKAQKAAVLKMAEKAKRGERTTEADARAAAEKVVIGKAKALLESLGWQLIERSTGVLLWAPSERPQQWTGVEIAAAVQTKRAPSSDAPPAPADKHLLSMLKIRYRVNDMYPPWIGLSTDDGTELPIFYAAHELVDRPDAITEEWRAMQARAEAAGWTLTVDATGSYFQAQYKFQPAKGSAYTTWGWDEMAKGVAGIESGRIKPTPAASQSYQPTVYTCEECKKKIKDYNYVDGRHLCNGCAKVAKQIIADRQAQIIRDVQGLMEAWLCSAPPDALRLLSAAVSGRPYDSGRAKEASGRLRSQDVADLARVILHHVVETANLYHAAPVYDSAPTLKSQRVLMQWDDDEAQAYIRQAEHAAVVLDEDGYATVANFVRTTRATLIGAPAEVPPGSTPPIEQPPAAQSAETSGAPLDELRAELDAIEDWLAVDGWAHDETRAKLAELAAIRTRLEALADAPDVSDGDYDSVMHTIRELEDDITDLLPTEASV